MKLKRIFALVAMGAGLAALATSAATTNRRPIPQHAAERPRAHALDVNSAELAEEIARLREHLHPTVTPQQPSRDLFHYQPLAAPRTRVEAPPAPPEPIITRPVPPPPMELIGIAEESVGDRIVRTAIVSSRGELFLAKEGDSIASRFRVDRISAGAAELTDTESTTPFRLSLK